jgi:SAM-dependent methyltransferase
VAADDHVLANRRYWDELLAPGFARSAERLWREEPSWGVFGVPESQVGMWRAVDGAATCVELGCGTAYVSAWLARRGVAPTGIDNSSAQLATAARMQRAVGPAFPIVHGDAERLPFADASFDAAISEYGASLWCEPERWLAEAARVLRPDGRLAWLSAHPLLMCCVGERERDPPAGPALRRPYLGMCELRWPDSPGVEFVRPHGDMLRAVRDAGFVVEDLVEVVAPTDATTDCDFVDASWASRWPCEEVWLVRRVG